MAKTFKGYAPTTPVEFDLESPDGQRTVHIRCKPTVPGSRFLDFMSRAGSNDDYAGMSRAVKDVFSAAIVEEDNDKFWSFCDDPSNGITIEGLAEIAGWLSEQYAGARPTVPSGA